MLSTPPVLDASGAAVPSVDGPRLRLSDFRFARSPSGLCRVDVELQTPSATQLVGRADGASSPTGDLRVAAEATLRALEKGLPDGQAFELVGVKALRAFDATIVIVAVAPRIADGAAHHLLGCYLATDDVNRGAAIAVLNATNRVLGIVARH